MRIEKSFIELLLGQGKCPLQHPEVAMDTWFTLSWIQKLGQFLCKCDSSIETNGERVIRTQREKDRNIMDCVDSLGPAEKDKIQQCRLYLQVQTLADICTANGKNIQNGFYNG